MLIEGSPRIHSRIDGGVHGDIATASMAVNSIPAVLAAQPGFRTMRDMRLPSFYGGEQWQLADHPRGVATDDVPGILAIYNDVIATSTAVYREDPATLDDRLQWFDARQAQSYPVLVATDDSGILGFASYGDFRTWPGYRFSVEHTVHIRADQRGRGVGHDADAGADPARDRAGQARDDRRRGRRQRGVAAVSRAARLRRASRTCVRWDSSSAAGSTSCSFSGSWTAHERPASRRHAAQASRTRAGAVRHDRPERAVSDADARPAGVARAVDGSLRAGCCISRRLSEAGVREALLAPRRVSRARSTIS